LQGSFHLVEETGHIDHWHDVTSIDCLIWQEK
jgi:hypothetical protein